MDQVELRVGESHTVTLKSLGAGGYRWSVSVANPQLVQVERVKAVRGVGEYPPGRSLDEQYLLTGLAPGETTAHFVQARSFEQAKPPLATYDVMVRVAAD